MTPKETKSVLALLKGFPLEENEAPGTDRSGMCWGITRSM